MTSMTSAVAAAPRAGQGLLTAAARLWWLVTLLGQATFLYYVAGFYGPSTLTGNFQDWSRNHQLIKGYVAGDTVGNLYFGAHVLLAAVVTFGGTLQMIPQIRTYAIGFHRWNGRAFMVAALLGSVTGIWMTWVRGTSGGNILAAFAISLNGALIILFAAVAWSLARRGKIEIHRRWALRLFMVANGVWFLRLGLFGWYSLTQGVGLTDNLGGPMNYFFDFACYLLPLAVLELYLWARDGGGVGGRIMASSAMLTSTAYMVVGIFGLFMLNRPLMPGL